MLGSPLFFLRKLHLPRYQTCELHPHASWGLTAFASLVFAFFLWGVVPSVQAQSKPANCEPPDVLLIVDFSNSMNWGLNGTQRGRPTKITILRQAYRDLLVRFDKRIRFGLITYTTTVNQPPRNYPYEICAYQKPIVKLQVAVGPGTGSRSVSVLNSLRADGCTPMLPALAEGVKHFQKYVIPRDTNKKRRRFVVLMTDGVPNTGCPNWRDENDTPSCSKHLVSEVLKLRSLSVGGVNHDIKTYVIGFGKITGSGRNQSMDPGTLNAMARAGGTTKYFQADDLKQLRKALETVANNAGGNVEVCNNKDDNCNGSIDENLKRTCQGACGSGEQVCSKGSWGACSSPPTKGVEVCNGKDDDCDGTTDEGLFKDCPKSGPCGKLAKVKCVNGKWGSCLGGKVPTEICNGKDDNCDGNIDEGLSRACTTKCGKGTQACIQGDWSTCTAPQPSPELCDGVDNNCDGIIDNGASCSGKCVGGVCYRKCTQECPQGFVCSNNLCIAKVCRPACKADATCLYGYCVPKDCRKPNGKCASGQLCDNSGQCVKNPCLGVKCGAGLYCKNGQCRVSCEKVSCPTGQNCQNGKCTPDPCAATKCPSSQICFEGRCFPKTCPAKACSSGLTCLKGACVIDRCKNLTCPTGQTCSSGECYGPKGPQHHDPNDPTKPINNTNDNKISGGNSNNSGNSNNGGKGCLCSAQPFDGTPGIPVSLLVFVFFLPFILRRRRSSLE